MSAEGYTVEMFSLLTTTFMSVIVASGFIIGSLFSNYFEYSSKIKADFAAFAGGIFFPAIAFSLVDEAIKQDSFVTIIIGFILGTVIYSIANHHLRKRSKYKLPNNNNILSNNRKKNGSSQVILVGTILDSIPETLFIGVIIGLNIQGLMGAVIALPILFII